MAVFFIPVAGFNPELMVISGTGGIIEIAPEILLVTLPQVPEIMQ